MSILARLVVAPAAANERIVVAQAARSDELTIVLKPTEGVEYKTTMAKGALIAGFDGAHGWSWRNRGTQTVTITLKVEGDYAEIERM